MKNFKMVSFIVVLGVALAGCQTNKNVILQPNAMTFDASKQKTKEAVVQVFLDHQYSIVKDSNFQIVFDKPATAFAAQFIYGSKFNGTPHARVLLTFTGNNPTTVSSNAQIVTNPGSGFERINNVSNAPEVRRAIHGHLQNAKIKLATKK